MRRHKRKSSGSKWMAVAAVALLAAVAWNAYRTPDATPATTSSISTDSARTTTALELPPPMAEDPPATSIAARAPASRDQATRYPSFLPAEAVDTLRLIEQRGPYPYRQDDGTFGNREGRLPRQARGYYREYTVETPGAPDRGARRIVAGGHPPIEYFYTDDHYASFRRFTLDDSALDDRTPSR